MAARECPREATVLEALQAMAWPGSADHDLQAHVASCQSCADLVAVVTPLLDEHARAIGDASVPASATMWWRLRLRARREAADAAQRPIALLQGLALAAAVGLLAAGASLVSPALRGLSGWLVLADVQLASPVGVVLVVAVMALAVAAPLAVYLAVRDE